MRKKRVSLTADQATEMVRDYRTGTHSTVLAARYDMTQPGIAYQLRKHGVRLRSKTETNRMRAPVDVAELVRLTEAAELSQEQIAQRLGVSQSTIERTLRALGLRSVRGRGSPGELNFFWTGGNHLDGDGYVVVWAPDHPQAMANGCVLEHRLVMERVLGRYLLPEEVVHHKDSNPQHNDPSNLQVFANQVEHMRHHWRESWYPRMLLLLSRQAQIQSEPDLRLFLPSPPASKTDVDPSP